MVRFDETKIKKILVIRPDRIGDLLMTTPALSLLREKFLDAHISILVGEYAKAIIDENPDIDRIIIDKLQVGKKKNWFEYLEYIKEFRIENFDLCINFYNDENYYALLPFLSKIPYRIADKSRIAGAWLSNLGTFLKRKDLTRHMVEFNCDLLSPLNVNTSNLKMKLTPKKEAEALVEEKLKNISLKKPIIGIHIGTGNNKPWTAEGFAKLSDALITKYSATIILTGSAREKNIAKRIKELCQNQPIDMVEKTSLEELIALIRKCDYFIGVDSGPIHIAAALEVPVAVIYTSKRIKPSTWGPWGVRNVVIKKKIGCPLPCFTHKCPENICSEQILFEDVLKEVETLLNGGGNKTILESKEDWFKKSLNTLISISTKDKDTVKNTIKVLDELKVNGYNIALLTTPKHPITDFAKDREINIYEIDFSSTNLKTIPSLLKIITEGDFNLIHTMDSHGIINLNISYLLSIFQMPISTLILKNSGRTFFSIIDIIEFYKEGFRKAIL
ncbi:MAG: glycosyltransferase family 9 protein [Candidatus Nanoarchaeia archaeon]